MPTRGTPRRPRQSDFGDKTWVDVQTKLARWARANYPRVDPDILEDALQDAVIDGMTYWQSLPSSHTGDVQKNFDYAVYRGKHYLGRHIQGLARARAELAPFDVMDGAYDRADTAPGPDVLAEELDLEERARGVLEEMSSDELCDFFTYLGGASSRDVAEKLGLSQSTTARRQSYRRTALQGLAHRHGLSA